MNGLTEKENELLGYFINKILVEKKSLDEEEHQELKKILLKLEAIEEAEEAKKKPEFGEVSEVKADKALIKVALKKHEELKVGAMSIKERADKLKKEIEALKSSPEVAAIKEKAKEIEDQKAFEEFYKQHSQKHGHRL